MTDPERLIASGSELERSLLLEAASEKPSAALLAKMEHSLGLAQTATTALGMKLVALAIGTAVVGGGAGAFFGAEEGGSKPVVAVHAFGPAVVTQLGRATDEPMRVSAQEPALEDAEPVNRSAAAVQIDRTKPKPAQGSEASQVSPARNRLSEEVALLDRVRAALSAGDAASARRLLQSYDQRFPNGVLAPEGRKLRKSAAAQ